MWKLFLLVAFCVVLIARANISISYVLHAAIQLMWSVVSSAASVYGNVLTDMS